MGRSRTEIALRELAFKRAQSEVEHFRNDRDVITLGIEMLAVIEDTAFEQEAFLNWRTADLDRLGDEMKLHPLHADTKIAQERNPTSLKVIESWNEKRKTNAVLESRLSLELGQLVRERYPALAILWTGPVPDQLHSTDHTTLTAQARLTGQIAALAFLAKIKPFDEDSICHFNFKPGFTAGLRSEHCVSKALEDRVEDAAGANNVGFWQERRFHSEDGLLDQVQKLLETTAETEPAPELGRGVSF